MVVASKFCHASPLAVPWQVLVPWQCLESSSQFHGSPWQCRGTLIMENQIIKRKPEFESRIGHHVTNECCA